MRKPASLKHQAVQRLRTAIRQARKLARQINRKLESLAHLNRIVAATKQELIKICGLK